LGTLKIAILEVDGVELEYSTEMDLNDALTFVGASSGFNPDTILADQNFDSLYDNDGNILTGVA